ncbi:MAG TPA: universal stress protein [Kofleriaceae bacterium]|nr:universal stress protein [Kofleriaceae bacterium]
MSRTVVAPVDFSEDSAISASVAVELAGDGGEVDVLHVAPAPEFEALARGFLDGELARLRTVDGHGPILRAALCSGDPVDEICRFAAEARADLIVMGTHGEAGSVRFLFGSVSGKVTRQAPCPVLVTRPAARGRRGFRNLLATVDYSRFSLPAAQLAASLVAPGGTLTLLHVWAPATPTLTLPFTRERQRVASDRLQALADRLVLPPGRELEVVVDVGSPAARILAQAERMGADLIVVGAHGRSGMLENVVGTVADRVLRHAHGPVLLVPEGALERPAIDLPSGEDARC